MHVVRRDHKNRAQNTDHAVRTCRRFVHSRVKITRLYEYDYQTWQTNFPRNSQGVQRFVGFFFLVVLFADWLGRQTPIRWLDV